MPPRTVADAVRRHINKIEPGTVFTPAELIQARIGSGPAIRQALRRLANDGTIRRIGKGYYDIPRSNARIGQLSATPAAIISALAKKTGGTIERPAVDAVNKLGLSTQVTAQPIYRTNLFRRDLNIGGQQIRLRQASPKSLAADEDPAELIIDALRAIGKKNVTQSDLAKLRLFVQENALQKALRLRMRRAALWMIPYLKEIIDVA